MSPPAEQLVAVREAHRFDETALARWLTTRLEGFAPPLVVRQFEGGQSNPTFLLETDGGSSGARSFVLRKKPPGKLLPTAHQVEREHRILAALQGTPVPVPPVRLLCEDESIIGTPFYVMDYVAGRIFRDPTLPDCSPDERRALYMELVRVLAELHKVDWLSAGLDGFGKPAGYIARQVERWTRQYEAAKTEDIPSMDRLREWLPQQLPPEQTATITHGDYRLDNLIFHRSEPRVLAVLDWELATLGDPLADVAYLCMVYHVDLLHRPSLRGVAGRQSGIPTEPELIVDYCRHTGRDKIPSFEFYLAFSLFRSASILQGVYKRGLQGNASSAQALSLGSLVRVLSDSAWEIASR
jgi:aminoglycoside phosphotransferase (APT) family kinase protein